MESSKYKSYYKDLLQTLTKRPEEQKNDTLKQAFQLLIDKAGDKTSITGKPYIEMVTDSAKIAVNEITLGRTSITALLLYHAIRIGKLNPNEVLVKYNEDIVAIANGLIKISGIEASTKSSQAETYRRMLLVLAKDVRAILIRLAEQTALMRNMKTLQNEEQLKIAFEASFLYAPLAHRLGLYLIKSELEDLSLKITDRENYATIARKLADTMESRKAFIREFIDPIKKELENHGFDFEIKGRPKSIHSIWNKIEKKGVPFEDIYDLFAIRIILKTDLKNEKADCWQVYSIVTDIFQPNPKRLRDWISVPKTNGYESLHTTVIGSEGRWVEVQIRTERMNEIAEKGVAAHWKYKGQNSEQGIDNWLTNIREILESPETDDNKFIDDFKLSLYSKEVFVFTPKGDLKRFPEGATVLDFAFDIHSDVGTTCLGAKIGGRAVPIRHKLQNGDKVEILTSKNQKPTLDWIKFVVTSKAQKKIRQKINEEKAVEAESGKELLVRRFKNWKIDFSDEVIRILLKHYKQTTAQDLYYLVSTGKIDIAEIKELVKKDGSEDHENSGLEDIEKVKEEEKKPKSQSDIMVIDEKVANIDYKLSPCCNPIMGDNIFGFVTINDGIKIHRTNCPNAAQLIARYGYRVVKAKWTRSDSDPLFPVEIKVSGVGQPDMLTKISEVISRDNSIKLRNIHINSDEGEFEAVLKITVRDLEHLDWLTSNLMKIKGVYYAGRLERN